MVGILEAKKGIIDAVDVYLSILKGLANWNQVGESASRQRSIILRSNGTISALGHSQSTGAENF